MTNARGEVAVSLVRPDGQRVTLKLRPSFAALAEMEEAVGPIMPLLRRIATGGYGIRDLVAVVAAGLKGAGEEYLRPVDVQDLVMRTGLADEALLAGVSDFLSEAVKGAGPPGEAEAAIEEGAEPTATTTPSCSAPPV